MLLFIPIQYSTSIIFCYHYLCTSLQVYFAYLIISQCTITQKKQMNTTKALCTPFQSEHCATFFAYEAKSRPKVVRYYAMITQSSPRAISEKCSKDTRGGNNGKSTIAILTSQLQDGNRLNRWPPDYFPSYGTQTMGPSDDYLLTSPADNEGHYFGFGVISLLIICLVIET